MKTNLKVLCFGAKVACLSSLVFADVSASAQDKNPQVYVPTGPGVETHMDLPGDFHKYYGQRVNSYRDTEKKIAKLDLDADMNYDGTIDNDDPADNGAFQQTPPGLVVGEGELSKFVLRLSPYRVDFRGEVVVGIEVAGINRGNRSGTFASLEEEMFSTGHIRVWADPGKKRLLLDSRDANRRYHEWVLDESVYPANLPTTVPRTVYVEGVSSSPSYLGDVRLLVTVSHRKQGGTREDLIYDEGGKAVVASGPAAPPTQPRFFKRLRTSYDHVLLTVSHFPAQKEFINNNAEGVWQAPAAGKGGKSSVSPYSK